MGARLPFVIGRYAVYGEISSGGMATVHYGRLTGSVGFSRTVAIKRLHAQFAKDPDFVAMFMDEARLAARIRHPNVVQTVDVVSAEGELFLVMDYVAGESLAKLIRVAISTSQRIPLDVVSAIVCGMLHGLHAAHEATSESGAPLELVHRDVSPQNVLVGADGIPRVLDFGVAKAVGRLHSTREGQLKGKLAYMAPEQLRGPSVDRRADVYAAGIVLWEMLTLKRLFEGDSEGRVLTEVLEHTVKPPSAIAPDVPNAVDAIALRALDRDRDKRYESARAMAVALEAAVPVASTARVMQWIEELAGELLEKRAAAVAAIEKRPSEPELPPDDDVDRVPDEAAPITQMVSEQRARPSVQPVAPSSNRWRRLIYVAVALGLLGTGFELARVRSREPVQPATLAPSVSESIATVPSTVPSEEPAASAPPPVVTPSASVAPRIVATHITPPAAASSVPCKIRTFVDESGIKHFVKECK